PFVDVIKEGADVTLGKPFVDVIKEGADVTLGKPFVDVIKEEDNNESVSKLVHADGELKNSFDADFVNGVASCNWVFCPNEGWHKGDGNKVSPNRQVVRATLMMHTGSTGNSDAECLVAPIFFNATFAEPELRYVKGNGAVSNFDADYDLSARLFVGEEPLTYSVANLWRVNVRWTSTANVPLFYNDASDAGGYILCVIAFKGTFPEGIIHVNSEMVNFNKKAFGLTISFTITCLTTPISGVVKLDFPPNSNECGPLLAGPIYHEIFSTTPPAIMLSLIPAENSSTPLDFYYRPPGSSKPNLSVVNAFEDFCLYNNANPPGNNYIPPRFKVCTVDTEKFWVWVEPPYYSGNCYLRWWAIPASASKNNNGDSNGYLPVKMGPLINVTNLGGDPINTIFFNEPFKVGIVNTFTENENLKINIVINARDNPVFDAWITLPPKVSSIGEWILPINLTPSTITVKAEDETPLHTTQFPHSVSKLFQNLSMSTGYSCNLIISFNPTRPLNNLGCITRVLSIRRSLLAFSPVDVWDYP
ncbi:MAG: hypothetical protein FWC74_10145, partial [Candidatus Bathyarchaeota archaeon]|nr:hypothetical protein [Candidatus Termitimicrobium sp.]